MKKNRMTQIIAAFALFGIVIGIIGSWKLILFSWPVNNQPDLTQEQLQELIDAYSGSLDIESNTWAIKEKSNTWTIETIEQK